jgi:signal peptidase I
MPLQPQTILELGTDARPLLIDAASLESAHAAKCELAQEVLRSFGSLRLQVMGFSMLPSVWPGELLWIRRQDIGEILPGDIVLFARDGKLVVHRVVFRTDEPETTRLTTQGDALPMHDSAITAAELLGRVCFILRAGRWVEPCTRLSLGGRLIAGLIARSGRMAQVLVRLYLLRRHLARKPEALCKG